MRREDDRERSPEAARGQPLEHFAEVGPPVLEAGHDRERVAAIGERFLEGASLLEGELVVR